MPCTLRIGTFIHLERGSWSYLDKKIRTPSVVKHINNWRTSNGEEMHGYLWQSTRLLAYDTKSLDGNRLESPKQKSQRSM